MSNSISSNLIERTIKDSIPDKTTTFNWHGLNVEVKPRLNIEEMCEYISTVINACFLEGTNEYTPEFLDFENDLMIIRYYTNITMPKDPKTCYDLMQKAGDLIMAIRERINNYQYRKIQDAIKEKIQYRINSNIDAINKQIISLSEDLDELSSKMENIFSGVTNEDMTALISALTDGTFDQAKLVDAYFEKKSQVNSEGQGQGQDFQTIPFNGDI